MNWFYVYERESESSRQLLYLHYANIPAFENKCSCLLYKRPETTAASVTQLWSQSLANTWRAKLPKELGDPREAFPWGQRTAEHPWTMKQIVNVSQEEKTFALENKLAPGSRQGSPLQCKPVGVH